MPYVIRNCPAILPMTKLCDSENAKKPSDYCINCTDCLLKQIVELCKEDWEDMTVSKFQSELLNKLAIEECE